MTDNELSLLNKWVKALRSGNYRQSTGYLRSEDEKGYKYCCLGALCDITDSNRWTENGFWGDKNNCLNNCLNDVNPLYDILGPDGSIKDINIGTRSYCWLTNINDHAGLSFSDIADIIEDQFIKEK